MTAETPTVPLDAIAAALAAATPRLGEDEQRLAAAVLRLLSAGAQRWTAAHPGTFVMNLGDAAELARRHAARAFGAGSA